ncbi:MAG: CHRD domain-containing protein [Bacteroidota bacterium]
MKNILTLLVLAFTLFLTGLAKERESQNKVNSRSFYTGAAVFNINRIAAWYGPDGMMERNPNTGNSGLMYPKNTSYAVYAAGMMTGFGSNDGIQSGPRVNGYAYNPGFRAGAILGSRTGLFENPSDPSTRVMKIRRDYATADLTDDAAQFFNARLDLVTAADIAAVREQYRKDWAEWPASKGAPFYDSNNDGIYTPQFELVDGKEVPKLYPNADEPGLANADQVLWYVCNDIGAGYSPWMSKPAGLEEQVTIWGYASTGVLQNVIYKRFKFIYKGTAATPEGSKLNDMYLTHWSDPDVGDAGDDFIGCDEALALGYIYNSKTQDSEYRKFNTVPPAVGYDFLQGPIVASPGDTAVFDLKKRPGFKNLPISSFIYFAAGGTYSDPPFNANGAVQWYQMMRGLPPTPQGPPDPAILTDPVLQLPTKFWLSGDPLIRSGWIDGKIDNPGDRRMLQTAGPFSMSLGDTQEVVIGVVGGVGDDYLNSIAVMKQNDRTAQFMYSSLFSVMPPNVTASVYYPNSIQAVIKLTAAGTKGKYSSITGSVDGNTIELFDDGNHFDSLANDGIYSNSITVSRSVLPMGADIAFSDPAGRSYSIKKAVELVTTVGPVTVSGAQVIYDNINNDGVVNNGEYVHYKVTVKNNSSAPLTGVKALVTSSTSFASEYSFGAVDKGSQVSMSGSNIFTFRLPLNYSQPTYTADFLLTDDKGNRWNSEWVFPVVQKNFIADSVKTEPVNIIGTNDGPIGSILYDKSLAGKAYQVWYGGYSTARSWTVVDQVLKKLNLQQTLLAGAPASASCSGAFTANQSKTSIHYDVSVSGLSGAVTSARVHVGPPGLTGPVMYTLSSSGADAFSGDWLIPDSLIDEFTSGNLYVNVNTAAHPTGEIRGQISDGLFPRVNLVSAPMGNTVPVFQYQENRLTGFSLFVAPAPMGTKSVWQTAPTSGNVRNVPNPEGTYRITESNTPDWVGKQNEANIEFQFNTNVNWAFAVPPRSVPVPSQIYPIKVPFAVFKDTVRVWPLIYDMAEDSQWNTKGNVYRNGKLVFDTFLGIVDTRDAANNDLSYFSPANSVFPPTSGTFKSRFFNAANHILRNVLLVNEKNDSTPPASRTTIQFRQYTSVKIGDIKSFSLSMLGVDPDRRDAVPTKFMLYQNYPNPFNPSTRIEFGLPQRSMVSLKIFDVIGREIVTLLNEQKNSGNFAVEWNGRDRSNIPVASGIYFYTLSSGQFIQTKKMILLK